MQLPILYSCTSVVLGSGVKAMACALTLQAKKQDVIVVTKDTFLYAEITHTGDYMGPKGLSSDWDTPLFPPEVWANENELQPDKLKKYGEKLFRQRSIKLLYACQVVGQQNGSVLIGHKSGLYSIQCANVYDCREGLHPCTPCYCLHHMEGGMHQVLRLATQYSGTDPNSQFNRYEDALAHLPQGATLARGGTAPTELDGLSFSKSIRSGIDKLPDDLSYMEGNVPLQCANPIHQEFACRGMPTPQAKIMDYDVVVVGGGTSGAVAALASAQQGMRTLLIEMNHQLGGTATIGGVSTYWFGCRDGATKQVDEAVNDYYQKLNLPRRKCLWQDDDVFLPDLKAHALLGLCLNAGVDVRFHAISCGVKKEAEKVTGVFFAWENLFFLAQSKMVIDCTGDGDICMFAGAAHTYGSKRDSMPYWGSVAQYTTPDNYRNNFSTMVHVGDPKDYTRFIQAGRLRGDNMYDHGQYVAVRESRHIQGLETVTIESIVSMAPVLDPLYICFSNYDPKGRLTADMVYFGLLPPNQKIPIPRGAVIPVDELGKPIHGILTGGKAISCTHDAFPGIRMQPDLQQQGLALGVLAACVIRQSLPPWQVKNVAKEIAKAGGSKEKLSTTPSPPLEQVIFSLQGDEPWEWLDAPPTSYVAQVSPIIQIMTAPSIAALPLLQQALTKAATQSLRLTLSRLLLWHGDDAGAPAVIEAISDQLANRAGLPKRIASINFGQLLPDHGLMPEIVYLLNSLGHARHTPVLPIFQQVLTRLQCEVRDWMDLRSGIYCYCECFAYVAAKRKDQGMVPFIHQVLALPELNQESQNELLQERYHMLRITLLGALVALNDSTGAEALTEYLHHTNRSLALAAKMLL